MLLILTNSSDATADYVCKRLENVSARYLRLDSDSLSERFFLRGDSSGVCLYSERGKFSPSEIGHVWLRRPQQIVTSCGTDLAERRHASYEWSEALEGFFSFIPESSWMNHPTRNVAASHKLEQLVRANAFGLVVPRTLLTQSKNEAFEFWTKCSERMIVKPLASGFLEKKSENFDAEIFTSEVKREDLSEIGWVANCPTLLQECINKVSDVRICVVDGEMYAIQMVARDNHGKQRLDIRRFHMRDVQYSIIQMPVSFERSLRRLIDSYELRFAAVDAVVDSCGNWIFLEINPNGQWAWLDLNGGFDIAGAFIRAFSK